jgi:hypothetical protein
LVGKSVAAFALWLILIFAEGDLVVLAGQDFYGFGWKSIWATRPRDVPLFPPTQSKALLSPRHKLTRPAG